MLLLHVYILLILLLHNIVYNVLSDDKKTFVPKKELLLQPITWKFPTLQMITWKYRTLQPISW